MAASWDRPLRRSWRCSSVPRVSVGNRAAAVANGVTASLTSPEAVRQPRTFKGDGIVAELDAQNAEREMYGRHAHRLAVAERFGTVEDAATELDPWLLYLRTGGTWPSERP